MLKALATAATASLALFCQSSTPLTCTCRYFTTRAGYLSAKALRATATSPVRYPFCADRKSTRLNSRQSNLVCRLLLEKKNRIPRAHVALVPDLAPARLHAHD